MVAEPRQPGLLIQQLPIQAFCLTRLGGPSAEFGLWPLIALDPQRQSEIEQVFLFRFFTLSKRGFRQSSTCGKAWTNESVNP